MVNAIIGIGTDVVGKTSYENSVVEGGRVRNTHGNAVEERAAAFYCRKKFAEQRLIDHAAEYFAIGFGGNADTENRNCMSKLDGAVKRVNIYWNPPSRRRLRRLRINYGRKSPREYKQ